MKRFLLLPTSVCVLLFAVSSNGQVPDWPELYDPFSLHTLHVQTIAPSDFDVIRADTTYDIEVPAYFWVENEAGNATCTTDPSGVCDVSILVSGKKIISVTFAVSNLNRLGGESYAREQNHDDDGNSNGS